MPDQGEKRFSLGTRSVDRDEVNDTVSQVQQYLGRFGYLEAAYEPGRLDEPTQDALRLFQQTMAIPETGVVDPETAAALEQPRCGVPDVPSRARAMSALPPAFVARGCDYEADFRTLTYSFLRGTPDLPGRQEVQAVRNAFASWQQQISIDFQEVGAANNPNFPIGWFIGDHGDGAPFDGVGNILAHAFYPPPCGGTHSGKMHFDDDELWALAGGANQFDVETVALHEIGHLLGLAHSTVVGSVMFPTYGGVRRNLSQDDIDGIRSLYGRRGPSLELLVHLQGIGDSTFRENEFAGTRGQSRRLEGFQLDITPPVPGLSLRYMAHLQGTGDVPFVVEGNFIGTRGEFRRLEGFAIELTGPAAGNFNVFYMAHLQGRGDTGFFQSGQFCGTRGESRRVEGILVRVDPR
jgi:Matrixin/Putative peptidoglycan binding domain/Clostridial hydrophobic W